MTLAIANQGTLDRMIAREKAVIAESERMRDHAKSVMRWVPAAYTTTIAQAKARLRALELGLLPIRITGKYFAVGDLIEEAQSIPSPIVEKAMEAEAKLPGSKAVVYGWDREALPAVRRTRDPVLVLRHANSQFFLGFWLELDTPDQEVPEFFGIVSPWSEPRGRGRPKKVAGPSHLLLTAGG